MCVVEGGVDGDGGVEEVNVEVEVEVDGSGEDERIRSPRLIWRLLIRSS